MRIKQFYWIVVQASIVLAVIVGGIEASKVTGQSYGAAPMIGGLFLAWAFTFFAGLIVDAYKIVIADASKYMRAYKEKKRIRRITG